MIPTGDAAPPAIRLLLACGRDPAADAGGGPDGGAGGLLAAAAAAVADWDAALALAAEHGLLPLLARRLDPLRGSLHPAVAGRLRRTSLAAAAKGQLLLGETARLAGLFAAQGVTALPWKGVLLAEQAHGDIALRDPSDLDFLVARRDAPRACALLEADGFRPLSPLGAAEMRACLATFPALSFLHPGRDLVVDLTWGFFKPWIRHRFSPEALLLAARPATIAGARLLSLPAEELLVALCLHASKHRWARLVWPCDIAGFARRHPQIDWERVLLLSRRGGVLRATLASLAVADRLFAAGLPATVARAVAADRGAAGLARAGVARHLAGNGAPGGGGAAPETRRRRAIAGIRHELRAMDRPTDRLRLLARWVTATNPNDWAWVRLPEPLFPLYALLRPVRLLVQNLGAHRRHPSPPRR